MNVVVNIKKQIAGINWVEIADGLNKKGFALVPGFLDDESCGHLLQNYEIRTLYRKTIVMERYRFGLGEYKYFSYPLPGLLQTIREEVYARVWPVANEWMDMLGIAKKFPASLDALREDCFSKGQPEPAVLILKYGKGGHNTLHQDLYGEVFFPLQLVIFLNERVLIIQEENLFYCSKRSGHNQKPLYCNRAGEICFCSLPVFVR